MRGNRSSDSAAAVSRSTGVEVVDGVAVIEGVAERRFVDSLPLDTLVDLDTLDGRCARADSTCAS